MVITFLNLSFAYSTYYLKHKWLLLGDMYCASNPVCCAVANTNEPDIAKLIHLSLNVGFNAVVGPSTNISYKNCSMKLCIILLRKMAEMVTLVTCVYGVPDFSLSQDTSYCD
jgi:hypothetical protein